jgi:hypothetical protein
MLLMPSQAMLEGSLSQNYRLQAGSGQTVEIELVEVRGATPMSDMYTCYSAVFRLPRGMAAEQGTYSLSDPQGRTWDLFLTPITPDANGLHRLEAVFHCLLSGVMADA